MITDTAKQIVAWVNKEGKRRLAFESIHDHTNILCRSPRGRRYVIICYRGPGPGTYVVRSLLGINKGGRATWLCNGQAAANTEQIQYWAEDHLYELGVKEWVEEMRERWGGTGWTSLLTGELPGGLPLPRHLTREAVLAALLQPR